MVALICLVVLVLAVSAFYSFAYVKSNQCVVVVNKHGLTKSEESDWISLSDLSKLQIMDDDFVAKEDIYIEIRTKTKINSISWNKISFSFDICAIARVWEGYEEIGQYQGTRTVNLKFSNFKWIVESVDIE